jgi:hypothetical protein
MSWIATLAGALAPWQSLYADSRVVSTLVTATHVITLLVGGGLAIAADRMTLRALKRPASERAFHMQELGAVHRPILGALVLLFVSGVALAAADVETFAASWVFWVKLGLVALLLVNGAVLYWTEMRIAKAAGADHSGLWRRLGLTARLSLSLWLLTAVAGTVLTSAA